MYVLTFSVSNATLHSVCLEFGDVNYDCIPHFEPELISLLINKIKHEKLIYL